MIGKSILVLSIIFIIFKGLNYGIDFKGGTLIELRSNNVITNIWFEIKKRFTVWARVTCFSQNHLSRHNLIAR